MKPLLSVVIPTHNPQLLRFAAVLDALKQQSLATESWELLIIDNASSVPVDQTEALANVHRPARIIREPQLGLSFARWRGITEANAQLIVFVDDDNLPAPDYLKAALDIFDLQPNLGALGGKSLPVYETPPPSWFIEGMAPLGCRNLGEVALNHAADTFRDNPSYPVCSPIGAGMVFRKDALKGWMATAMNSRITDRSGTSLSSAGDCDIVLHILSSGWDVGYSPSLVLYHLISEARVQEPYLRAISFAAFRDFVCVLGLHGIVPWSPIHRCSIPLRAARSWIKERAWRGGANALRWSSALGQFEGRARLRELLRK